MNERILLSSCETLSSGSKRGNNLSG